MRRRVLVAAAALALAVSAIVAFRPAADEPPDYRGLTPSTLAACTRVAAPNGDDDAAGTKAAPYRTVGQLLAQLRAGETGCLRAGTFAEDVTIRAGGARGAPVVLAAAPGETVTLRGRMVVEDGADDVVVTGLRLNGRNEQALPSPTINGDRVAFLRNDVTNEHTSICFVLGSAGKYGTAVDVMLSENRVHHCGRLPATNRDHGVYVESARRARIVDNVIYENADRGVQLYPDAQETVIERNVIVANGVGVIFSGEGDLASSGNHVVGNLIGDSRVRWNVESYWPGKTGTDNIVEGNCLWNGRAGNIAQQVGFEASDNHFETPRFVDRERGDFRQRPGNPCADLGPAPGSTALWPTAR